MCIPNPTSTVSRARHCSAPASLVKSLEEKPLRLLMIRQRTCRLNRHCTTKNTLSKEDGDCPTDQSPVGRNSSDSRLGFDSFSFLNDRDNLPNPAAISESQITCRPTLFTSKNSLRNETMCEKEWFAKSTTTSLPSSSNKRHCHHLHRDDPSFAENRSSSSSNFNFSPISTTTATSTTNSILKPCLNHFNDCSYWNNPGFCRTEHDRSPTSRAWNESDLHCRFKMDDAGGGGEGKRGDRSFGLENDENERRTRLCGQELQPNTMLTRNSVLKNSSSSSTTNRRFCSRKPSSSWSLSSSPSSTLLMRKELMLLCFCLTLILSLFVESSEAKICSSMNIKKHSVEKFKNLTDCTIIEGHLIVAAFEESDKLKNLTFPKLREVTEYVIFYEAQNIVKLSHLFPNLAVIRGNKLLSDFALIIYKMDMMVEIGLTSLTHILRGGVRIHKNRNLCYVNTIDWQKIVSKKYHSNILIKGNQDDYLCPKMCPNDCRNLAGLGPDYDKNCWDREHCQIDPMDLRAKDGKSCDSQCIGGCFKGGSRNECYACRQVLYEFSEVRNNQSKNCIQECPDGFLLHGNWRCVLESYCNKLKSYVNVEMINQERPYKVYDGKCLESCPADTEESVKGNKHTCEKCIDCSKECPGKTIRTLEGLRSFEGCTRITGDLTIQINGKNVVDELEDNLGRVTVITGSLKVSRSFPIVSLDFFKSLTEIQGISTEDIDIDIEKKAHYSLELLENENLQKLFPANSNVTITQRNGKKGTPKPGKAFIHYNQKLCPSEIKRLLEESKMFKPGENSGDISYGTNGHKSVCSQKTLNLEISADLVDDSCVLTLYFDNYRKEIARMQKDTRVLLAYEIHYREIDLATFKAQNLTKFGGRDACGNDEWTITDHPPTNSELNENGDEIWPQEVSPITEGIKPFSHYAVFVSTLIIRDNIYGSEDIQNAASEIQYFATPEGYPNPPQNIGTATINSSAVNITWQPPDRPNGIIEHYEITVEHHRANRERLIRNRDYCMDKDRMIKPKETDEDNPSKPPTKPIDPIDGSCDCTRCPGSSSSSGTVINMQNRKVKNQLEENSFVNDLLDVVYTLQTDSIPISKRRKRSTLSKYSNATQNVIHSNEIKTIFDEDATDEEIELEEIALTSIVLNKTVHGNMTHLMIENLSHFSKYTITIRACLKKSFNKFLNKEVPRCSEFRSFDFSTKKKLGADNIKSDSVRSNSESNNGTDVWITWDDPPDPNLAIIYYNFKIRLQNSAEPYSYCVNAKTFEENGRKHPLTIPGSNYVQVQAWSLAGPGEYTDEFLVVVGDRNGAHLVIILPVFGCILLMLIIGLVVYYYYKKKYGDEITMNPIYMKRNFGDFEIHRDLIEKGEKLGSGSFGTVYSGIFNHPTEGAIQCAIKEAKSEELGDSFREKLLDEAYIMRTINTPHVVRLLGVVTNQFPQYVILEYMDKGDLKRYLMKLRNRPPRQVEILLMALQVADGMAYLSTVPNPKIVHRDLAARNCLVHENMVVKISDFGLARDLDYAEDYYRMRGRDRMPIRWMAPESIRDNTFSTASDIWSFGMVLWEMVTLGEQPYQGMTNEQVVHCVREGETNGIPRNCPELIAALMNDCWKYDPDNRPNFIELCDRLFEYADDEFKRNSYFTSTLCSRITGRITGGPDVLQHDESSEHAPLRPNGNSNGNGEARIIDNGFAVVPNEGISMQELNNPNAATLVNNNTRQYNFVDQFLRIIRRNRMRNPHNNHGHPPPPQGAVEA